LDINYINLKFEVGDKIIEVGKGKPYRLLAIEGISSAEYDLSIRQNISADGSKITRKSVKSRPVFIVAEYVGMNKKAERDNIVRYFNLHESGKLTVNNNGISRLLNFDIEKFNASLENMYLPLKFKVDIYCSQPYFTDISISSEEMVTWIGGLTFPLSLPTQFAMAGEKIINIINNGDVATPITLEISGTATNPKITNTLTGEYIKVNRTLVDGDTLIITTEFGNKRVEQNGINVFNYIDLGSTFFSLNEGDNVIELTTDDINDNATIRINYKNRYLGV